MCEIHKIKTGPCTFVSNIYSFLVGITEQQHVFVEPDATHDIANFLFSAARR